MAGQDTLIVFSRYPEPGRVKTRLIPALGPHGAAELQREMTRYTLDTAAGIQGQYDVKVQVHHDGPDIQVMRNLFGPGFCYITQEGRDLGDRMHRSFLKAFADGSRRVVLTGTDCPGITEAILTQAFYALNECDCVIGPSVDGGYYLLGLTRALPEIFKDCPWGTGAVFRHTLDIMKGMGLRVTLLERLADIDRPEDLHSWYEALKAHELPMISVVIPAINEEAIIGRTVQMALSGKNIEVIVVDGKSTDRTQDKAQSMGARVFPSGRGRAKQMNEGAGHARGSILLFLHADTMLSHGYDERIRAALSVPGVAAGAFSLRFDNKRLIMKVIAIGANLRSRFFKLPYGDQGVFVRKKDFYDTGGFPDEPIMEDVAFVRTMKKKGRIAILPSRITTSARRYLAIGPFRNWGLNQLAMVGFFLGMQPKDIASLYHGQGQSPWPWMNAIMKAVWNRATHKS